jgi:hypothetical protein
MPIRLLRQLERKHLQLALMFLLLLSASCSPTLPGVIQHEFPTEVNTEDRFVIYLHGKIIEDQGVERPTSPEFGVYEYEAILTALAEEGLHVISEVRTRDADPFGHARQLTDNIQDLLDAGVQPGYITIVGVSKGGGIAILTAALLQNDHVNFVFLAGCGEEVLSNPDLTIAGRILSIYEKSDDMAVSCQPLFDRSSTGSTFEEIHLDTGLGHGEFYTPRPEWTEPTVGWAMEK